MTTPTLTVSLAGESTSVNEISFRNNLLFVTFSSNVTYCYEGVTFDTVRNIVGSESVGSALHKQIISQPYPFTRLSK